MIMSSRKEVKKTRNCDSDLPWIELHGQMMLLTRRIKLDLTL